jgi:hypothetical protein
MTAIKYAKSASVHVAYQVFGSRPHDLIMVPGAFSHQELVWATLWRRACWNGSVHLLA